MNLGSFHLFQWSRIVFSPRFLFTFQSVNIQCNISFRCILEWFDTSIQDLDLITTNLLLDPYHLFYPIPSPPSCLLTISLFSLVKSLLLGLSLFFSHVHLFCFLNSTYEWNHIVFVFLWLTYLTSIMPSRYCCKEKILSFLWLGNIP